MRLSALPLLATPLLVGVLPPGAESPRIERTPRRRLVRFENVVRNESSVTLRDVSCDALLPDDGPGQTVRWLRLSGHDWTLSRDSQGQWCARATMDRLAPGDAIVFSWLAAVELEAGGPGAPAEDDDAAERAAALADDPALCLADPAVVAAARAVRRAVPGADPEALALRALDHVRENVRYELDGGWRPAPDVLRSGAGSCSETTFAYVALCRRLGLPARWIGGTLERGGYAGRAVDTTFHRLAEVHLPGRGWVRVETTPGSDADPGEAPAAMLVLARGVDGGGAAGLYYHARNAWRTPRESGARPRITKRAYWVADPASVPGWDDPLEGLPAGNRPSFARCERLLADAEGFGVPVRPGALGRVPGAGKGQPEAVAALPWLVAAGHPGGLRLAAEAVRSDPAAMESVVDRVRGTCTDELGDALVPLLGAPPAAFEAWWARDGARVVPLRPGLLGLSAPR